MLDVAKLWKDKRYNGKASADVRTNFQFSICKSITSSMKGINDNCSLKETENSLYNYGVKPDGMVSLFLSFLGHNLRNKKPMIIVLLGVSSEFIPLQ